MSFGWDCYDLAIREVTLAEIFQYTISIVRYKILRLEVEKHHFNLIIGPHVNKYMFQHVSGSILTPEILGDKCFLSPLFIFHFTFKIFGHKISCNSCCVHIIDYISKFSFLFEFSIMVQTWSQRQTIFISLVLFLGFKVVSYSLLSLMQTCKLGND
jgi:hypothetical protein